MAFEIPFVEPAGFAAGDRVSWKRTLSDFPISDSWTLKYYLRGNFAHEPITLTATTDGTDYLIDVATADTAGYAPGVYYWSAVVEKDGYRMPVATGRFVVTADLSSIPANQPFDGRSHARRALEAIQAVLEGRATTDIQSYVFQAVGRSVNKMTIKDLLLLRDYYLVEVQAEEAVLKPYRKNIFIHFNR